MQLADISSFQQFISEAIIRNRPRLIVCSYYSTPSLHLLLAAKRHCQFIDFGYVSLSSDNSASLSHWLGLSTVRTAMFVYKEQRIPVVSVKVCGYHIVTYMIFNSLVVYLLKLYGIQLGIIDY